MKAKLYVLPGSHPCAAVEAALALKGIAYDRVDLLPLSQPLLGPALYGGTTVPGLRIAGQRLTGSRAIMRALERLVPEPPLYPASEQLAEAERWGEEDLQNFTRRLVDAILLKRPAVMEQFAREANLPLPLWLLRPALPLTARLMALKNGANEQTGGQDLAALPGRIARIDEWIEAGVLGGQAPNAADLQIGSSVALLLAFGDFRGAFAGRPAARLAGFLPPLGVDVEPGILLP